MNPDETEIGKQELIWIFNETYWSKLEDIVFRQEEFCLECKNEVIACVCMDIDN